MAGSFNLSIPMPTPGDFSDALHFEAYLDRLPDDVFSELKSAYDGVLEIPRNIEEFVSQLETVGGISLSQNWRDLVSPMRDATTVTRGGSGLFSPSMPAAVPTLEFLKTNYQNPEEAFNGLKDFAFDFYQAGLDHFDALLATHENGTSKLNLRMFGAYLRGIEDARDVRLTYEMLTGKIIIKDFSTGEYVGDYQYADSNALWDLSFTSR